MIRTLKTKPREILIRCGGEPRPGVAWVEFLFVEWNAGGFSVYERARYKGLRVKPQPRLLLTVAEPLTFRQLIKTLRRLDGAVLLPGYRGNVRVRGLEPWQHDVIVRTMTRHWAFTRFLNAQPVRDLKLLHDVLGNLLSRDAEYILAGLNSATFGDDLRRRSLRRVAQIVGAPDPRNLEDVIARVQARRSNAVAEAVLSRFRGAETVPPAVLLRLLDSKPAVSDDRRAELLELWMRSDPKPLGGPMFDRSTFSGSEFPFLRWLLFGHVRPVFIELLGSRREQLEQFVAWLLDKVRGYAAYFQPGYRWGSYNVFTFGRPLYRACLQLALEVESEALALGLSIPDGLRLPAMPALNAAGWSIMVPATRTGKELLKKIMEAQPST